MSVVVVSCMALLVSQTCMAGSSEFRFYPQFRYMGGLPGNGWAVNGQGEAGFDGAMSQTIPIGYTPSRGSYALGYHVGSTNGGITTSFGGPGANGTLAGTIGFRRLVQLPGADRPRDGPPPRDFRGHPGLVKTPGRDAGQSTERP